MVLGQTVGVFVCVAAGVVSKYFLCLCLLNALFQIMQVSNAPRKSLISVCLYRLFQRSGVTTCQVRKCTGFIEYFQCMFKDLETCIHVHHWLAKNDFNYSDGFPHRLWWISAYFFILLKVVVYLPFKDIVGNDDTSCIFLLFWDMKVSAHSVNPGISAIVLITPHAHTTGVFVCVCVYVFVCSYESV
jgi:hypothetical protein